MKHKVDIMKKKLGMLKKEMDKRDCKDESDVMEEHGEEVAEEDGDEEEKPSAEKEILASKDKEESEEDPERESLRQFMRGSKPEKKKGMVTVMIAAKSPSKSPFKGKAKKA